MVNTGEKVISSQVWMVGGMNHLHEGVTTFGTLEGFAQKYMQSFHPINNTRRLL